MKLLIIAVIFCFFYCGCERPTDSGGGDDGIPPGVPEGLRIYYASDGEIIIDWLLSNEADIKQYNIYRSTDSVNFSMIDSSFSDYYADDSLFYDTVYSYKITAMDIYGNESGFSSTVSAKPANLHPPGIPRGIAINARNWEGKRSIFLSWNKNNESDIAGYKIYRSDAAGFMPDTNSFIGFTLSNEYEDTTAADFYHFYYYIIKAIDKGGLVSGPTAEIYDRIFEEPVLLSPPDNSEITDLNSFIFRGTGAPADYKIILQTNRFFGEVWQSDVSSVIPYDTLRIFIPSGLLYYNKAYYWRVAAYSAGSEPNSITPLYKFIIKP